MCQQRALCEAQEVANKFVLPTPDKQTQESSLGQLLLTFMHVMLGQWCRYSETFL